MTSWRHTLTSYDILWQDKMNRHISTHMKLTFSQFSDLDLWPMTLPFKLIRNIVKVKPHTKFCVPMSNASAVRAFTNGQTHRTERTNFIPSAAYAGGKIQYRQCKSPQAHRTYRWHYLQPCSYRCLNCLLEDKYLNLRVHTGVWMANSYRVPLTICYWTNV